MKKITVISEFQEALARIKELEEDLIVKNAIIKQCVKDLEFLDCLTSAGVDNWSGYSEAQEMMTDDD